MKQIPKWNKHHNKWVHYARLLHWSWL